METIFFILLVLVTITQSFIIYNLYQKYDKMESEYDDLVTRATENEEFILSIRNRVMSQRSYLKQLDNKGAFESDDEVGYFFKELKKIINDISVYFEIEPVKDEKDNEPFLPNKIERF